MTGEVETGWGNGGGKWRQCAALIGRGLGRLSKELAKLRQTPRSDLGGISVLVRNSSRRDFTKIEISHFLVVFQTQL